MGKLHTNLEDSLGGEYLSIDENDLLAIDREGRAIMTEHELEYVENILKKRIFKFDILYRDGTSLVIINVYCPRVDQDKPERLTYKLNFYAALEKRARCFLEREWCVLIEFLKF